MTDVARDLGWAGLSARVAASRSGVQAISPGRRLSRLAAVWWLILGAALAGWFLMLRPHALGGPATYIMVRGVSMQPAFQPGDLILTRPAAGYRVGDVVAYRVPQGQFGEGIVVMHRILGGGAEQGFVVQGDNTTDVDEWRPRPSDIVGKPWIRVPRLGRVLAFLHAPVPLASLAAGLAVAAVVVPGPASAAGRRRPRRQRS